MATHGAAELALRNLSWMSGNTFLAWSAVLFALHLRGTRRQQLAAAAVLLFAAPVMLAGRLAIRDDLFDQPIRSMALIAIVATTAAVWSWRAIEGDRWARVVGYVGVLAFAPNAPYVLTDMFHHTQDVRLAGFGLGASLLFAVQYGWFLVLGAASWVALLALGRDWLQRHRPGVRAAALFVPICGVMAFGIYLGRIERFHSWHPMQQPHYFLERVVVALTSAGPLGFTLVWWVVVMAAGIGGLWLYDRARAAGAPARSVLVAASWALSAALLSGTPLIDEAYHAAGVDTTCPSRWAGAACVVLGVATCAIAGARFHWLLHSARATNRPGARLRARRAALVASIVIPLGGCLLTAAAVAQWYAQFRGLCEYSPDPILHGDTCRD